MASVEPNPGAPAPEEAPGLAIDGEGPPLPPNNSDLGDNGEVLVEATVVRQEFEETWIFSTTNAG